MTTTSHNDPATIEQEIRRTQDDMSSTVDKIGDQLSMRNVFNALLDKADNSNVDARMLLEGARRNPVALGLVAAGTIWLISEKDAKFPSMPAKSGNSRDNGHANGADEFDFDHNDYDTHMATIALGEGEDPEEFYARRSEAQARYFKVERSSDEDDHSFRQRLTEVSEKFAAKRHAMANSAMRAREMTGERASQAMHQAQALYAANPMIGGFISMALGAAFGTALPTTRMERDQLGDLSQQARGAVAEQSDQVTAQVREHKDALVDKADAALAINDA